MTDAPKAKPDLILIATGWEVGLIVAAARQLLAQKVHARVVSMPSWELRLGARRCPAARVWID